MICTSPKSPTSTIDRSVQSLRDTRDRAWQVFLYQHVQSGLVNFITLRLVGFPGTQLAPTIPLIINAGNELIWTVSESAITSSLPTHVREYDFKEIIVQLRANPPL
ncbi:MAG: DUF3122 domain-containing protein [Actinomycetota bacterium]